MSEKTGNNWEKFLTGDNESDSARNSPVTGVKPVKEPENAPTAETKPLQRSETLEEKIARVMAGINMPKKSVGASKSKKSAEDKAPARIPTPTNTPNNGPVVEENKPVSKPKSVSPNPESTSQGTKTDTNPDTDLTPNPPNQDKKPERDEHNNVSIAGTATSTLLNNTTTDASPPAKKLSEPTPEEKKTQGVTLSADATENPSTLDNLTDVIVENKEDDDQDDEYEPSDDDEASEVIVPDPATLIAPKTATPAAVANIAPDLLKNKMTLSDLEEIESIVAQVDPLPSSSPPPSQKVVAPLDQTQTKTHTTPPQAKQSAPILTSPRPGINTRHSVGASTTLAGHLSRNKPPPSSSSSSSSVNSGGNGSRNSNHPSSSSSVSSFTPQPRRLPDMAATTSGYTDSQLLSPDSTRSRQTHAPWSLAKRLQADSLSSNNNNMNSNTYPSPNKSHSTFNSSEEHRVTVAVRIRPFMIGEIQHGPRRVVSVNGDKLILVNPNAFDADPDTIAAAAAAVSLENMRCNDWAKVFCFDHCLWSYDPTDTEDIYVDEEGIYEAVGSNIVNDITRGVSSCCFAYGHTGTGKTHTMLGEAKNGSYVSANDNHGLRLVESAGLAPRVFLEVVERVLGDPELAKDTRITISFLEIYQEKLRDCLVPSNQAVDLKVREHPALGPYVENLQKVEVHSPQDALALLYQGYCERSTGQNNRNRLSSRSHAIFTLELTSSNAPDPFVQITSKNNQPHAVHKQEHVRLQMVDLAGSEKEMLEEKTEDFTVKKGTMTPRRGANIGDGSVEKLELKMIRRSLSTLGYIIKALGNGLKAKGLPFRDSLLTWLLKDSFMCKSNTTMLATISPSHTCFDETLSTLKYAERLCHLGTSSNPGNESSARVSIRDTIDPQLSYTLATEFSRLKRELGGSKHGSVAARHLLQQTLSDPQQRLARMEPYQSSVVGDSQEYGGTHSRRNLSASASNRQMIEIQGGQSSWTNPNQNGTHNNTNNNSYQNIHHNTYNRSNSNSSTTNNNNSSALVVDTDLKEAYRQLHGKYVELQIELENARTDRDGMQLERQHMQDALDRANADRYSQGQTSDNGDLTAALRNMESEVEEMRGVVMRKEEAADRLLNELAEERKARDIVEQTARAQVTELIKRLEGLHKQGQEALQKSDTWQSAAEALQAEKTKLSFELSTLKEEMEDSKKEATKRYENINRELQLSVKQYNSIVEERDQLVSEIATFANEKAQMALRESSLSERNQDLQINLEKATNETKIKSELEIVKLQRDSLYEIINQQEKQIQVQQQQAAASLKMLHQRQEALDRYEQKSEGDMDELITLQNSLHKLLANEGELLQSELVDARKMTEVISSVKEKVREAKVVQEEITRIQMEKTQLQESVDRLSQEKKLTANTLKSLNDQVDHFKKHAVDWETRAHYWQQTAQKNSVTTEKNKQVEKEVEAKSMAELDLRSENAKLQELLDFSQQEAAHAKEELEASKEDMQKEFSSLWLAVEQLNKLDATKDKAMADLTTSYDEACANNRKWEEKYNAIVRDYDKLQRELQAIDLDLLDKADIEGIEVSSLLNHTFSPSRNGFDGGYHSARSATKPRTSSRSRSPQGSTRRASHDPSRSHSNQRLGGHPSQSYATPNNNTHGYHHGHHGGGGVGEGGSPSDYYSVQSGGSKRYRDGPGGDKSEFVKRNQMKPDKRMSEKGLEEQIVELSQFLEHDSERFQSQQVRSRMRVSTNSSRSNK